MIALAQPLPRRHAVSDLPWPIWFFIASMIVPTEMAFSIDGVLISPQRLVLMGAAAGIAAWVWRRRDLPLHDYLILAAGGWAIAASFANLPAAGAIERGGAYFLETAVAYLLPSACLAAFWQIRLAVRAFVPVVGILAALAAVEAIEGTHFIAFASAELMEAPEPFTADERFGLLRARATFSHQILFGVFCASLFALFWFEARTVGERVVRTVACTTGVFFSLSSAALLILVLQVGLVMAETATRAVRHRAGLALATVLAGIALIELAVAGGIAGFVTRYLALNAETASYRQLIWTHVTDDILANPLTGTGGPWTRLSWMVESIDHAYFAKAIGYGIPTVALTVAGAGAVGVALIRVPDGGGGGAFRALRLGWFLCVIAIATAGLTVDYFGRALPYVMFILGLGAALERAGRRV